MTTDDICCDHGDQIMNRLDRALELLEDLRDTRRSKPRGYTLADQFNDLIQRHDKGVITDAKFYEILAEITGIRHPVATGGIVEAPEGQPLATRPGCATNKPPLAQNASDLIQRHEHRFMTKTELRRRITETTGTPFPEDE